MDKNSLQELIDLARKHKITPSEQAAQVRSFTYGNTHLENDTITREDVDKAVSALNQSELPWEAANSR
jgi:hypothetical protein